MNKTKEDFKNSYITLLQGDTYAVRKWLKEHGAKYNPIYNWYFPHDVKVPEHLPTEIIPVRFGVENMLDENGGLITDKGLLQIIVDTFRYPKSPSEWVGKVGDTMTLILKYKDCRSIATQFGVTNVYTFEDVNQNIFKSWTSRALPVEKDQWYKMTARIKDHSIYRNEKQTMISYIKGIEPFMADYYDSIEVEEEEQCSLF